MIHVECPDCSKSYEVAEALAGKACGARIPIPQLRTDTAERTKPAQPKPVPTKSPSPKATTAPPAKSKPTVKPKPAPKKREDDFFEEVAELDGVGEVEDFEISPRVRAATAKRKAKKSGAGLGGFTKALTSLAGRVKSKISPFYWRLRSVSFLEPWQLFSQPFLVR